MTIAKIKDQLGQLRKSKPKEAPEADPRDEQIASLERAIAEERAHAAALRKTIDELRFRTETLERSYAKQLGDARQQHEIAAKELDEHKSRLAEIDATDKDVKQQLGETRAALERVTAERDRLRRALASPGSAPADTPKPADSGRSDEEMSIDELLEDAIWAHEQKRIDKRRGADADEPSGEPPAEEMISPDLVFAAKARAEDDA